MTIALAILTAAWVAALGLSGGANAQTRTEFCRVSQWNTSNEAPAAAAAMTVQRDRSCTIILRRRVASERVSQQPRNGTVSIGPAGLQYRPHAGFVGEDRFVYEALLPESDPDVSERRRTLTVNVVVQAELAAAQQPPGSPGCLARPLREGELPALRAADASNWLMQTRAGARCPVPFDPSGRLDEESGPQNGTLSVEANRMTYMSRPDFRGRDRFLVRWTRGDDRRRYQFFVDVR